MVPPAEAVQPLELPPTQQTPSSLRTKTFPSKAPHLSLAEVPKPPSEADVARYFEDLIIILNELSANGGSTPRFSTIFSLWRDRKSDAFRVEIAGTVQFEAYLRLAESAGIVAVERRQDGDGWVTLPHRWNTNSNSPPQHAGSQFRDLIKILNDLQLAGDPEPQFSTVGPRLLRKNPSIYRVTGVTKFEEYVQAAAEAGVITVHGVESSDGRLRLRSAYRSSPVYSPTPIMAASTPPILVANAASPFAPLVEFLKSKRLASPQPISFSETFAHLNSTLGYADLVSLCTSVPGVTTFGQYLDAAIASGLVSLVEGTIASRTALVSLRVGSPDSSSPPVQPSVSTFPPLKEIIVSPPPVNVTPSSFWDLTAVLTELRVSTGESVFRFSRVVPLLLRRKPNAYASVGVTRFIDYVTLAMENGVVTVEEIDQDHGWVSLSDQRPGGPDASLQSSKSSGDGMDTAPPPFVSSKGGGVDPKFVDLVETLGEIWKNGEEKPLFSFVGAQLLKDGRRRVRTLNACGVSKFKAYAKLAEDAGIIEIYYGLPGEERMSLDPTIRVKAGYA